MTVDAELMGLPTRFLVPAFTYAMTAETRKERSGKKYPEDYRITCAVGARYWGLKNAFGILKPIKPRQGWLTLGR